MADDNNIGLHKKISSIFDGVPIPKDENVQPPPFAQKNDNANKSSSVPKDNDTMQSPCPPESDTVQKSPDISKDSSTQKPSSVPKGDGLQQSSHISKNNSDSQSSDATEQVHPGEVHAQQQTPPTPKPQHTKQPKPKVESPPVPSPSKTAAVKSKTKQPKSKTDLTKQTKKAGTAAKSAALNQLKQTWQQVSNKLFAPKPGVSPAKQKAMTIMVPILFIVLIFVFINLFSTPAGKTSKSTNLGPKTAVAGSDRGMDWQIPEPYPTTLRDPMQFGSVTTAEDQTTAQLIVKGIVYSEDNPCAVIGTKITHEGDEISGITIVKISENNVEFESKGKSWTQQVQR